MADRRAIRARSAGAETYVTGIYLVAVFLFLYLPILVLILLAFNDSQMTSFPFRGFTTRWFLVLLEDEPIRRGLINSIIVAVWTTVFSVLIGTMTAYALIFYRFPGRIIAVLTLCLPVVVPKTVLGLSILTLTTHFDLGRSLATLIFGHVLFCVPFVTVIVASVMMRLDRRLIEAARDLGAGEWRTFRKIVLPLILNGIIAGAFVTVILSFAEFNLSFFLSGREQTLPLVIFSEFRFEITPKINALSAVMVAASILLTVLAELLRNRKGTAAVIRPAPA